jgi:hypothetical protein
MKRPPHLREDAWQFLTLSFNALDDQALYNEVLHAGYTVERTIHSLIANDV